MDNNNGTESVNSNNKEILNNETAIVEIFESLRAEYQSERTKKNSFETRAGFIIAFLGVILVSIIEKVPPSIISYVLNDAVQRSIVIKFVLVAGIYGLLFVTTYMAFKTIDSKQYSSIDVSKFDEKFYKKNHYDACKILAGSYKSCIMQYRTVNEKNGKYLRKSIKCLVFTIILSVIYFLFF